MGAQVAERALPHLGGAAGDGEPAGAAAGAAVPSELAVGAGEEAGAGAGVELLHPLRMSAAERAKLAANARDFSRMANLP